MAVSTPPREQSHDPGYLSALRRLWERSAYDRGFISNPFAGDRDAAIGRRRTAALLERLGRPQDRLQILHVAGSKGKGSTCAFASSVLTAMGRRTGLYTSPHLHTFRERIAIDGESITESAFAAFCERAFAATERVECDHPELGEVTTFELTTAMALDYFAESGSETAVVEVGLGGLLDATNVVDPAASLITVLDYEHTSVLGSTIAEIAVNKAGIIKPRRPVATAALVPEALRVVREAVEHNDSLWLLAGRDWTWRGSWRSFEVDGPWGSLRDLATGLAGGHQVDNACLAIAGVWLMTGADLRGESVRSGVADTNWPGRFEVVHAGNRTIVLDGAHTPAAATALAKTFAEELHGERAIVLLGVLNDKDPLAIAEELLPIAGGIVAVTPPGPRGLPARDLTDLLAGLGIDVHVSPSISDALQAQMNPLILVTGSLTTVASAREVLGLAVADPRVAP